jgi:hypothetical protein
MSLKPLMILSLCALAACGGDKKKDDEAAAKAIAEKAPVSAQDYRKQQIAFADSVLNGASSAKDVANKLGKDYDVASIRLRDTVAVLATKSECFKSARGVDPYVAGTVDLSVHFSVVGSDAIRVQESKWTSPAGNITDACLNKESQKWKFDATFGKQGVYIVQVQFR